MTEKKAKKAKKGGGGKERASMNEFCRMMGLPREGERIRVSQRRGGKNS
jgi:hypothetical protein